jgi:hypothetical protein
MDDKELARLVAADLGADVAAAVATPERDATRAFGLGETMAVGSFVASCAQLAVQIWQARQDRALLVLALAEGLDGRPELASRLDPERRLGLIGRVVNKLVPERFGASPSIPAQKPQTRKDWIAEWLGPDDPTRAMNSPVLMPFAEMDHFIVYKPIHWTPPAGADASLPRAISVPTGFVTDLASIPPIFWWAIRPTGRHGHAAILHDWLYWEQGVSRAVADRVFEVAMAELDVDRAVRKAMWAAVRVGGGDYWLDATAERRQGKNRVLKRMPDKPVSWEDWRKQPDVFA